MCIQLNVLTMAFIILAIWYDTAIDWRHVSAYSAQSFESWCCPQFLYLPALPSAYLIKHTMYSHSDHPYVHYIDATTTGAKLQGGAILCLIEWLGEVNTIVPYCNGWNMLVRCNNYPSDNNHQPIKKWVVIKRKYSLNDLCQISLPPIYT